MVKDCCVMPCFVGNAATRVLMEGFMSKKTHTTEKVDDACQKKTTKMHLLVSRGVDIPAPAIRSKDPLGNQSISRLKVSRGNLLPFVS